VNLDAALAENLGPWYYPLMLVLVGKAGRETACAGLVGARFLSGGRTAFGGRGRDGERPAGAFRGPVRSRCPAVVDMDGGLGVCNW
jgi:hypothetical protein